jgi:hypothetical protein
MPEYLVINKKEKTYYCADAGLIRENILRFATDRPGISFQFKSFLQAHRIKLID